MEKTKKEYGLYIRLTDEEEKIVKTLKKDYSVNMSQFLRNQIIKLGEKLKTQVGKELWKSVISVKKFILRLQNIFIEIKIKNKGYMTFAKSVTKVIS